MSRLLLLLLTFTASALAFSGGPPIKRTGALIDNNGATCAVCHVSPGGANSDPLGSVTIHAGPYRPGVPQIVRVRVEHPEAVRWGFQLTARLASNDAQMAGTFSVGNLIRVRCDPDSRDAPCNGDLEFASHNATSTSTMQLSGRTFEITWTPPAQSVGEIVFYASGNAANGSFSPAGDRIYTTTIRINQATSSCTFGLTPMFTSAPASGSTGLLHLFAAGGSCGWVAASSASWLQLNPLSGNGESDIRYTVFPNFRPAARTASALIGSETFIVNQAADPRSYFERLAGFFYFGFFGRNGSPGEIALQASALSSRPAGDLAAEFMRTPEFNGGGRFVAGLYVGLLNRDAEFGGWLFQRNALATGAVAQEQLVANFIGSPEFTLRHGSLSNADFVRVLYRQILLREPTPDEVAFQAAALDTNARTRTQMASGFLNSDEFRIGTEPRLTAFLIYATILQRGPSADELQWLAQRLQAGASVAAILNEFLSSAEFGGQV